MEPVNNMDPKKTRRSKCVFRITCESRDDLVEDLRKCGVKGHFEAVAVDYNKVTKSGEWYPPHVKQGKLFTVFEVEIFEENKFFINGGDYIYQVFE
jgi:hypothetical protein